jgi:hypothetical protein
MIDDSHPLAAPDHFTGKQAQGHPARPTHSNLRRSTLPGFIGNPGAARSKA